METFTVGRRTVSRRRLLQGTSIGIAGLTGAALLGCGSDEDAPSGTGGTVPTGTSNGQASQTPAEKHETKPADEKQQDINEELERQ